MLILREETIKKYGYDINDLGKTSKKLCIVKCLKCNKKYDIAVGSVRFRPESNCINCYRWTDQEKIFLKEFYGKISNKKLATILKKEPESICSYASNLGLTISEKWTTEEENLLKKYYPIEKVKLIASKLNRSENAIISHASTMGLEGFMKWKLYEIKILKMHYGTKQASDLCQLLPGRSSDAIIQKAIQLKLAGWVRRTYSWNHNFFNNPNPIASYYAGFIDLHVFSRSNFGLWMCAFK
jgi:hypothetical protein